MEKYHEPFLKELWSERAEEERGEPSEENKDLRILLDLETAAIDKPELQEFLNDLEIRILRYERSIARRARLELEGAARKDVEDSDETQRRAHNALVDDLNILERVFSKAGLDTRWRNMIGLHRDQVGKWAQLVAPHLRQLEEVKHASR